MLPSLDIFRVEGDGHLLWCSAAESQESARRRIKILMATEPADYVIYCQQTGGKTVIRADQLDSPPD
jgi:hypothetical protein